MRIDRRPETWAAWVRRALEDPASGVRQLMDTGQVDLSTALLVVMLGRVENGLDEVCERLEALEDRLHPPPDDEEEWKRDRDGDRA